MTETPGSLCRREVKYIIDKGCFERLCAALAAHILPAPFPDGEVLSLYYDTPQLTMACRAATHPDYKEKLRLRAYGTPRDDTVCYAEIKRKCGAVVYKRRAPMKTQLAQRFMAGGIPPANGEGQIIRELRYAISQYPGIAPTVFTSCRRQTLLLESHTGELRVTADTDVRCRTQALRLTDGAGGDALIGADKLILEIKSTAAMPLYLARALDALGCRPTSCSKYLLACRRLTDGAADVLLYK